MRNLLRHSTLAVCAALLLTVLVSGQTPALPPFPPGQGYPAAADKSPRSESIRRLIDRAQRLRHEADHPVVQEQLGRQRGDMGSYIEEGDFGRTLAEYLPARQKIQECERSARDLNNRDAYCHAATKAIAVCQSARIAWGLEQKGVLDQAQRAAYDNRAVDMEMYLLSKRELLPCPSGEALEGLTPEQMLQKFKDNDEGNFQWARCDTRMNSFNRAMAARDFAEADKELVDITPPCTEKRAQAARDKLAAARPAPAEPTAAPKPAAATGSLAGFDLSKFTPDQLDKIAAAMGMTADQLKKAVADELAAEEAKKKLAADLAAEEEKTKTDEAAAKAAADAAILKAAADLKIEQERAKEAAAFKERLDTAKDIGEVYGLAQQARDAGRLDLYREGLQQMQVKYPATDPINQVASEELWKLQEKEQADAAAAAKAKADAEAAAKAPPRQQSAPPAPPRSGPTTAIDSNPRSQSSPLKKLEQCAAEFEASPEAARLNELAATNPGNLMMLRAVIATMDLQMKAFEECSADARYPETLRGLKAQKQSAITTCGQIASTPAICTVSPWK